MKEERKIILASKKDKVVSVKDYLMHKLEPREDVLSPVISMAMSPERTISDMGVVWGMLRLCSNMRNCPNT